MERSLPQVFNRSAQRINRFPCVFGCR
jgi:hypothetical protein